MAWKKPLPINEADRNFYASFSYVRAEIFKYSEQLKDRFGEYYNIKINRNQSSPAKLNRLRQALTRLYDEVRPKLITSGSQREQDLIKEMDEYESTMKSIPFNKIISYKNILIDWIEKSGLSRIDIEKDDIVEQAEKESFGEG